jgi:hypothetical protein
MRYAEAIEGALRDSSGIGNLNVSKTGDSFA